MRCARCADIARKRLSTRGTRWSRRFGRRVNRETEQYDGGRRVCSPRPSIASWKKLYHGRMHATHPNERSGGGGAACSRQLSTAGRTRLRGSRMLEKQLTWRCGDANTARLHPLSPVGLMRQTTCLPRAKQKRGRCTGGSGMCCRPPWVDGRKLLRSFCWNERPWSVHCIGGYVACSDQRLLDG